MPGSQVAAGLRDLEPLVKREAARVMRKLPASIDVQDVQQAARDGAWEALKKFDGRGKLEPFALQHIRWAITDWQRKTHPAGRDGPSLVFEGEEALDDLASDDNQAASVEQKDHLISRLRGMPASKRGTVVQVASGVPMNEVAKALNVSPSRVSQLVREAVESKPSARMTAAFDPAAVQIKTGPLPIERKPQKISKHVQTMRRMCAGGYVEMAHSQAGALARVMWEAGIQYAKAKFSATTSLVIREPTPEQLAQLGRKVKK
jgi:RNA polymerase sigma factor (sigma-70 family)